MKTNKREKNLPDLCRAIKRVRETYHESQPQFGRRVNLAPMTVSRFERGQVPADFHVLARLAKAARARELREEAELFDSAAEKAAGSVEALRELTGNPSQGLWPMQIASLPQWRLMHVAGIVFLYFPDRVRAVEEAAGPALAWVDEAIRQYAEQPTASGLGFNDQLAQYLTKLAEQRALEQFRREGK